VTLGGQAGRGGAGHGDAGHGDAAGVTQATVRSFDAAARSGSVFTDDGAVLPFGPAAFGASGLRLLRPGQRVRLRCAAGGQVTALALVTFPLPPGDLSTGA
jgi:hypothetical protein